MIARRLRRPGILARCSSLFANPNTTPSKAIGLADVLQALQTQGRVIHALVLRETKSRYGNHKIGFLWGLIEPLVSVLVFVAIFSVLRHNEPGGMPLVTFMIVGFCCYGIFRDPWNQMQMAIPQSRPLLTFPQVTTFDVIIARALLEAAVSFFVLVTLLSLAWIAGYEVRVERPLELLAACALLAIMSTGLGFVLASLNPIVPSIRQVTNQLFGRPLYFGSGLFYTVDSLPQEVIPWLLYNPILHLIELARGAFFHEFETEYGSWLYASAFSLGLFALGLLVHQSLRDRAVIAK